MPLLVIILFYQTYIHTRLPAVKEKHHGVIDNTKQEKGHESWAEYLSNKQVSSKEEAPEDDIHNLSNQLNELQQQFPLGRLH